MFNEAPKPLTASMNPKNQERAQPTFWFERESDGLKFCTGEEEAWNIMRHGVKIMVNGSMERKRHRYLGCSDGRIYFEGVRKANEVMRTEGLAAAQDVLRKATENECASANPKIRPQNHDVIGDADARREMMASGML